MARLRTAPLDHDPETDEVRERRARRQADAQRIREEADRDAAR